MTSAHHLVHLLTTAGRTIAVAESLTGGMVTDVIIAVPGASECLRGGVVAYATDVKASVLGVSQDLLDRHGAVHPDVAVAMAAGVRDLLGADYGIATTGVAGPMPQDGVRPGTVHVAVVGPDGTCCASPPAVVGGRPEVRLAARDAVLALAVEVLVGPGTEPEVPAL